MSSCRTNHLVVALLAVLLLGTACGRQPSGNARIQQDTAAVVKAMNAKDYPAARRALATLDSDLAAAGRLQQLGATTVSELRAGVATLKADLALVDPTPSPSQTPPPFSPSPTGHGKKKHDNQDQGQQD